MVKDVVGAFWFATSRKLAAHDDTALGEINLLANLIHQVPLVVGYESRCDELGTDVAFAQGLFIYLGHLMLKDVSPFQLLSSFMLLIFPSAFWRRPMAFAVRT